MQPALKRSESSQIRLTRLATIAAILIVLLFAAKVAQTLVARADAPVSDLISYYDGAARLRAGLPLYRPDFSMERDGPYQFIYPPPLALLLLPLPSYRAAWWAWAGLSIGCWLFALGLLLRELAGGLRARLSPTWRPVLIAALINFPPVLLHLFWGQLQLLLLLLLVGSWLCLRRDRDVAAGVLLGFAIALKLFPALLCIPLLAQRKLRVIVTAGVVAAGVLGLSFALIGWDQSRLYLTLVLPQVNQMLGQRSPGNNSIASMLRNAIGDTGTADLLSALIRVAVVATATWAAWRLRGEASRALALGATTLMLVLPVIWEHYFVLAYLPWLDALARMRRRDGPALALAYFLLATASLAYSVPAGMLAAVQALPLCGALLLLWAQARGAARPDPEIARAAAPQ